MRKSNMRRALGVLGVVMASQLLTACVVVPVPAHRPRAVVVQPGYAPAPYPYRHHHEHSWGR